ncbi:hypothetical protein DdX_01666 [Ditylenchus destructor]|uniref:Uncharacterized protein n=1 Tax=Ditylenchus destructor TaxID=166010 RepID=A0AAD4RE28_9BILA|nr:hypothetical protein DdX_01666 [Ditylenchus destructor]
MPRHNVVLSSSSESDTEEYEHNKQSEPAKKKRSGYEHTAQYYPQRITRSMSKQRQFPQQQPPTRPAQQAMREKSRTPNPISSKQSAVRGRTPNQNGSRASMQKQQPSTSNQRGSSRDPQQRARSRSPGMQNGYIDGAIQMKSKLFNLPSCEEFEKESREHDQWVEKINNDLDKTMARIEKAVHMSRVGRQ